MWIDNDDNLFGKGDLCQDEPELPACKGHIRSKGNLKSYLDENCDSACAKSRCNSEPKCVGYTKKFVPGKNPRYKLKSKIESFQSWSGFECWTKSKGSLKTRKIIPVSL